MNLTRIYARPGPPTPEQLTVMAYLGLEAQDGDEIRLIRTVGTRVVEDGIAFHGNGGQQWLQQQHNSWTSSGFQLITETPGV